MFVKTYFCSINEFKLNIHLLKSIPYIYIYFLLSIYQTGFSQNNKSLQIEGSDANSTIIIQQIDYPKEIENDSVYTIALKTIREKLNYKGFIQHEIISAYQNDSLYYVQFKLKHLIDKIQLTHPKISSFVKEFGLKTIDSITCETPYTNTASFINQLTEFYQNNGFPFVAIRLENITKSKNIISADLIIDENGNRSIDKIIVKGYASFPKSFLKQAFRIETNKPFSKKNIQQVSEIVQATPFVSEIKKPEVLFTKDSTTLYLYLKREKSNHFDGLVGFSTAPDKKKIQLYGNIDFKIQNSLNRGETLQLKWLSTQDKSQSLKVSLQTPYLFNTPLTASYDFNIYKQDTTFLNISNYLNSSFQFATNHKVGFVVESKLSDKTTDQTHADIVDFSSFFYGVSYNYIKPNYHPIFNQKIQLYSEVTRGKRNALQQHRITNYFLFLLKLSQRQNIVIKNTTALLLSNDYLENELFRIGGSNSIRGFDENSLVATRYSYLNTEYNYLINEASYLSLLADLGVLNNDITSSLFTTYSFGIGFTQKTKIGMLGVQYFIGNTNKNSFSFSNSKLHLKIVQLF